MFKIKLTYNFHKINYLTINYHVGNTKSNPYHRGLDNLKT